MEDYGRMWRIQIVSGARTSSSGRSSKCCQIGRSIAGAYADDCLGEERGSGIARLSNSYSASLLSIGSILHAAFLVLDSAYLSFIFLVAGPLLDLLWQFLQCPLNPSTFSGSEEKASTDKIFLQRLHCLVPVHCGSCLAIICFPRNIVLYHLRHQSIYNV
jgi:hypothetical protein